MSLSHDNTWKDRNVFVTGCTGLLGSWVTKGLADAGANVVGLIITVDPDDPQVFSARPYYLKIK